MGKAFTYTFGKTLHVTPGDASNGCQSQPTFPEPSLSQRSGGPLSGNLLFPAQILRMRTLRERFPRNTPGNGMFLQGNRG